ncbi:MAG TPA: endopeptidase La [Streptosporangiaceae bacterium]|jgi:ATP-dependent Lon protease|nr:endopeptidase La [Streptosporangiaceae bacterium]
MSENTTLTLPVLPLDDDVVLPTMVVPLDASDAEVRASIAAAHAAAEGDAKPQLLLVPRIDGKYAPLGTLAVVEQEGRLPDGKPGVVLRGMARVTIGAGTVGPGAALWVHGTIAEEPPAGSRAADLARDYRGLAAAILQKRGAWQVVDALSRITDPSALADSAGYASYLSVEQRSELLNTLDPADRLEKLVGWARDHLAELDVAETIGNDVREGMEKQQREFLLRQQLAAIRKELAALDGTPASEEDDYRARIEDADLPEKVREAALREAAKLERGADNSPEAGWIRTWLDTILDVPWKEHTDDAYDIGGARSVLDADHAGLDEVKERIIEYLAVRKRLAARGMAVAGGRRSGAVLALAGPPGVGKTSLGESVARAMGRKFARVALGGVRDEAEIRGHRRTYVGALPGRIVRAIREAGSMNPVILLDEVDKLGADYRGDPTAALLEVLDPAQNHTFRDHYLEVELDLSDVLFIATANVAELIPEPLLDRMELIRLDGYTEDEKVTIARDHLLPRQLARAGMSDGEVEFTDDAFRRLATEYTREAGVRNLERSIARVLRKIAAKQAQETQGAEQDYESEPVITLPTDLPADGTGAMPGVAQPAGIASEPPAGREHVQTVTVNDADLTDYLGHPRFTPESAERTAVPGVAAGLAVTGTGGDLLFIEASLADAASGSTGLTLTGQLGDVMKESAQIALSYLQSNGPALGLPVGQLAERAVHLHVPAGAVPKDGPSAGITMTTALASLLSGRLVRADVAMTGEVSLTGRVLPIGGLKQKLLAAHRAGITTVLIPARNEPDLDDVPEKVREALEVHLVSDVREVLDVALEQVASATDTPDDLPAFVAA